VTDAFRRQHGLEVTPAAFPAEYLALLEEVVRQKHMLRSRTEVKVMSRIDGKHVAVVVTRKKLAQAVKPLMERIRKITLQTIADAKADPKDVHQVLAVGGSSRLRPFEQLIEEIFGPNTRLGGEISPDLAVAEGAVIHAARKASADGITLVDESLKAIPAPSIKHRDAMPHSLGIITQDRVSSAGYCSVILERNTPIPCQATKMYSSVDPDQAVFRVMVVQAEDGQPAADCLVVAERELNLPPRDPLKESIEVTMGYDESGMVKVTVKDLVSGITEDITIDFYAKA
jgi:molecular chaperone DnaK